MDLEELWFVAIPWAVTFTLLSGVYAYHYHVSSWRVVPKGIPWYSGTTLWWPSQVMAHLQDFTSGTKFVTEGYKKFSKSGKPFIVPAFVTWQPEVVLPPSQVRWLVEQPDSVLSIDKCLIKDLEFTYTTPKAWSFARPFHVEAINKLRLDSLVGDMAEEVQDSIDREWGVDTDNWKEVNIEETMGHVLTQITARVIVGEPLCRDPEYIKTAHSFFTGLVPRAIFISLVPDIVRPVAGWLFSRGVRRWNALCASKMMPLIQKEMFYRRPSDQKTMPLPKTLLEQMARLAIRSADSQDGDAFSVSSRLLALNFVAVHTSNHALVNGLADIMSPPAGTEVFQELREEAEGVSVAHHGKWSKGAVLQLLKIDSALRESLRLSTFKSRGTERVVVAENGVELPDGTYLPKGTKVGVPVLPIHHDSDVYPDAMTYDAFRFCKPPKAAEKGDRTDSPMRSGHLDLINTSETFLAFGHGKHACPGRFLAAYELKLIIAYIAMNYDVQPFEKRPENAEFSDFSIGSMHTLQVRRRKASDVAPWLVSTE